MEGEFQDWELLLNSDAGPVNSDQFDGNPGAFDEIDGDARGNFMPDYFSLENISRHAKSDRVTEEGSVESGNPSSNELESDSSETLSGKKDSSELGLDSSVNRSVESESGTSGLKKELGFRDGNERVGDFDRDGGIEFRTLNSSKYVSDEVNTDPDVSRIETEKIQADFKRIGESQVLDKDLGDNWSGLAGGNVVAVLSGDTTIGEEIGFDENEKKEDELGDSCELGTKNSTVVEVESGEENSSGYEAPVTMSGASSGNNEERKSLSWWKVPFELIKYYIFKVSPVWSVSMAAAVMGFVILGRRLYNMKKKSRRLQLKVTFNDKKVSQVMTHAARLNEAFSMVRRVPMVRPLPALGSNAWPVMSLR